MDTSIKKEGIQDVMDSFDKILGKATVAGTKPLLMEGDRLKKECRTETLEEAIRRYDRAIELDPRCAEAWYKKGHCHHLLRREEEAVRCYDEALRLNDHNAEVWYNKGNSLMRLNQQSDAHTCLKKAQEIDPRFGDLIEFNITGMLKAFKKPDGTVIIQMPFDPREWSK